MRRGPRRQGVQNYGVCFLAEQKLKIGCHQMRFLGCQNSLKYLFVRVSVTDPTGNERAHSALPNLLAALRGLLVKKGSVGKRETKKKKGGKEKGRRKNSVKGKKKEERTLNNFLVGAQNLKLRH